MKFVICPGAQKSGTTTLYSILKEHPEVCMARKKETRYFVGNAGGTSVSHYLDSCFQETAGQKIHGDVDPEYMYCPEGVQKIYKSLGRNVRFIFMLRNPVDRAYSHYWMSYRRGIELEPFERAIELEEARIREGSYSNHLHLSYVDRGFYYHQISRFREYYDMSQMKFVLFKDFVSNQTSIANDILDFLDLSDSLQFENLNHRAMEGGLPKSVLLSRIHGQPLKLKKVAKLFFPFRRLRWQIYPLIDRFNISDKKPPMMELETRRKLISVYRDDIKKLADLIGRNLDHWLRIR